MVTLFIKCEASILINKIEEVIKVAKLFNKHITCVCNALTKSFFNFLVEKLNGNIRKFKALPQDIEL